MLEFDVCTHSMLISYTLF